MMDEELFRTSFVREYLRYIQKEKSTLTGVFELVPGERFVWGAIAEYGSPPQGGLIIEMWSTTNGPDEIASFRYWYAKDNARGKALKGRVVMRDELTTGVRINA